MWDRRSFLSTRGQLLVLLKKRGPCSVAYLSEQLGLTRNAIRQHLSALERDNLVSHRSEKTGPSKPFLVYSLTPQGAALFPTRHEALLLALLQELQATEGDALAERLARLGRAQAEILREALTKLPPPERVPQTLELLSELGSLPEWEPLPNGGALRDYNCPYGTLGEAYPAVCQARRGFLQTLLEPAQVEADCQPATGHCQFWARWPSHSQQTP